MPAANSPRPIPPIGRWRRAGSRWSTPSSPGPVGVKLLAYLRERLDAGAVIFPPQPLRALELTPPEEVRVVILGPGPVPRPRPGRRAGVLGGARRAAAAFAAQHLQGTAARPRYAAAGLPEPGRQPGEMGRAWGPVAQHLPHGGGGPGRQPFGARLGGPDRRGDPPGGRARPAGPLHAVGRPCPEQAGVDRYKSSQNTGGQPSLAFVRPATPAAPSSAAAISARPAPGGRRNPWGRFSKGADFVRESKALGKRPE